MKKITKLLVFISLMFVVGVNYSFAGTDAAAFLKKSVGVKAIGMGGAFTSLADDTSAIYWNPAGLSQIQDYYSVYAMGTTGVSDKYPGSGLEDVVPTHQFFAVSIPFQKFTDVLGKTVIGIGYISSKMDNVQYNDGQGNPIGTGKISDTDNAYYLTAGIPLWQSTTSLYVGASLKYITKNMSEVGVSDSGIDVDAGVIYSINDTLKFGAVFQKGVQMGEHNAPMTTRVGVSDKFVFVDKFQLTGAIDLVQRKNEPLSGNVGLEFGVIDILDLDAFTINGIFLRGGLEGYAIENRYDITSDYNETASYNFGLGFDFSIMNTILQLDIAICSGNIFDQNTKFALNFFF